MIVFSAIKYIHSKMRPQFKGIAIVKGMEFVEDLGTNLQPV